MFFCDRDRFSLIATRIRPGRRHKPAADELLAFISQMTRLDVFIYPSTLRALSYENLFENDGRPTFNHSKDLRLQQRYLLLLCICLSAHIASREDQESNPTSGFPWIVRPRSKNTISLCERT